MSDTSIREYTNDSAALRKRAWGLGLTLGAAVVLSLGTVVAALIHLSQVG